MAKYTVQHTCGHEQIHDLTGPHKSREYRLESLAGKLCADCWQEDLQKRHAEDSAQAAKSARLVGLPELNGSQKQMAWAETLRSNFLKELDRAEVRQLESGIRLQFHACSDEFQFSVTARQELEDAAILIRSEPRERTEAKWWIDNRGQSAGQFFQDEFASRQTGLAPAAVAEASAFGYIRAIREIEKQEAGDKLKHCGKTVEELKTDAAEYYGQGGAQK